MLKMYREERLVAFLLLRFTLPLAVANTAFAILGLVR